jgi:hypothetical protein
MSEYQLVKYQSQLHPDKFLHVDVQYSLYLKVAVSELTKFTECLDTYSRDILSPRYKSNAAFWDFET